mmetsp:Transcript_20021/g.56544  ORF Transcript_20021/g.56544 Transcript_20021/m.56544 type:complete len:201 (+) Transcript_20021:1999-2601(+)
MRHVLPEVLLQLLLGHDVRLVRVHEDHPRLVDAVDLAVPGDEHGPGAADVELVALVAFQREDHDVGTLLGLLGGLVRPRGRDLAARQGDALALVVKAGDEGGQHRGRDGDAEQLCQRFREVGPLGAHALRHGRDVEASWREPVYVQEGRRLDHHPVRLRPVAQVVRRTWLRVRGLGRVARGASSSLRSSQQPHRRAERLL